MLYALDGLERQPKFVVRQAHHERNRQTSDHPFVLSLSTDERMIP